MTNTILTQAEADALMDLEKRRFDTIQRNYPGPGEKIAVPVISTHGRERFSLDLRRGRIGLSKGTYQTRGRQVIVLARLDFGGAPHRNPDGEEIGSPHLHLYRAGYGDKWAFPLPDDRFAFTDLKDRWIMFEDFMRVCNIVDPPNIQRGLF